MSEFPSSSSDQFDPHRNLPHQRRDSSLESTDAETYPAEPARFSPPDPEAADGTIREAHEYQGEPAESVSDIQGRPAPNQVAPRLFLSLFKRFRQW